MMSRERTAPLATNWSEMSRNVISSLLESCRKNFIQRGNLGAVIIVRLEAARQNTHDDNLALRGFFMHALAYKFNGFGYFCRRIGAGMARAGIIIAANVDYNHFPMRAVHLAVIKPPQNILRAVP